MEVVERERAANCGVVRGGRHGWWLAGWLEVGIYMQVDIIVVAAGEGRDVSFRGGAENLGVWGLAGGCGGVCSKFWDGR